MSFAEAMKEYFPLAVEIGLVVVAVAAVVVFAVVEVTEIGATFGNKRGIFATTAAELAWLVELLVVAVVESTVLYLGQFLNYPSLQMHSFLTAIV